MWSRLASATYAFSLRPFSGASLSFVSPLYRRVSARSRNSRRNVLGPIEPPLVQRLQIAPAKSRARLSPRARGLIAW
jgi:hypothetical protein